MPFQPIMSHKSTFEIYPVSHISARECEEKSSVLKTSFFNTWCFTLGVLVEF